MMSELTSLTWVSALTAVLWMPYALNAIMVRGHLKSLTESEKEDIAVMALKVIAADGRREVAEMEQFSRAVEAVGASPEIVHRAFDRYFAETNPGM